MTTEEIITTDVKVSDAEIDNLVGRGIVRVLRHIGHFVYNIADCILPMCFYLGVVMSILSVGLIVMVDTDTSTAFYPIYKFFVLCSAFGAAWVLLERDNVTKDFAKWLKIYEL